MTDELLERAMQESAGAPASHEPVPVQNDVSGSIATPESLEQIMANPCHADLFSEIEAAIDQQMQQMEQAFAEQMQEPEPPPPPEPPPEQMYDPWSMNPWGMGPMM